MFCTDATNVDRNEQSLGNSTELSIHTKNTQLKIIKCISQNIIHFRCYLNEPNSTKFQCIFETNS